MKRREQVWSLPKEGVGAFLEELGREYALFVPAEDEGIVRFEPYRGRICPERLPDQSPKEVFFPRVETLLRYRDGGFWREAL